MKIYNNISVWDAAIERISWMMDSFECYIVSISGGKDSTVAMELSAKVAREKGKLPLDVVFLDQEAEWQGTIDYMKELRKRDDIRLHWYQMPMKLFSASGLQAKDEWLYSFEDGKENLWIHPREKDTITTNDFNIDRFKKLFSPVQRRIANGKSFISVNGMRADESLVRYLAMSKPHPPFPNATYVTGTQFKDSFKAYPLYDWVHEDIWSAIGQNNWKYNHIYDKMFMKGLPKRRMRVSSLIHEYAIISLRYVAELEPETHDRLVARIGGANTYKMLMGQGHKLGKLPPMFMNWKEYRDYLFDNITAEENKAIFLHRWNLQPETEDYYNLQVAELLANDFEGNYSSQYGATKSFRKKTSVRING